MRILLVALVTLLVAAAPASAQDACTEPLPSAPLSTATTPSIELRVLVLMDGVSTQDAANAVHAARTAYDRLGIDLVAAYRAVTFTSTDLAGVLAEARALYGGARPSWAHTVHVFTDKTLSDNVDHVPGTPVCIGGARDAASAFAASTMPGTEGVRLGRVVMPSDAPTEFGHRLGHLLGGQHQHASCEQTPAVEPHRIETSLCSLMFADYGERALAFGTVDGAVIRGFAERFVTPIAEPMPVFEPEPDPQPGEEDPPAGPLDPELETLEPWIAQAGPTVDAVREPVERAVGETLDGAQPVFDETMACTVVAGADAAPPSAVASPRIELRMLVLLDGATQADADAMLALMRESYDPLGIDVVARFEHADLPGSTDAPSLMQQAKAHVGGEPPGWAHLVYVLTTEDLVGALDIAGQADCLGGIRDRSKSFAVGEVDNEPPRDRGLYTASHASTGTVAAHEVGHLLGARHETSECASGTDPDNPQAIHPCTIMTPQTFFASDHFGPLEHAVVRGYAEAFVHPLDEPLP